MRKLWLSLALLLFALPCNATATYYLANASTTPAGNDANSGLDAAHPWLTPNHALTAPSVIIAAPSADYLPNNFNNGSWGTCSSSGNFCWLTCATFDGCKMTVNGGGWPSGMALDKSYWGIQGWEVTVVSGEASCFLASPNYIALTEIHHIIFANNIANGCHASGFTTSNSTLTASVDYLVIVGNIAYNTATGTTWCYSGITVHHPIESDALPGTHIYIAGNFTFGTIDGNPCGGGAPSDGEGINIDTLDSFSGLPIPYAAQVVVSNNLAVANGGMGVLIQHNNNGTPPFASVYILRNTTWGNNNDPNTGLSRCGELELQSTVNTEAYLNLAATNAATGCSSNPIYAYYVSESATTTNHLYQNWGYSASGSNVGTYSSTGFSEGPNNTFGTSPAFANPVAPGAPSCGAASSVPNCMATVIANFTPTNAAAKAYGYQVPSSTSVYDPLYPQWLCSVTNLPSGLVTPGCVTGERWQ